MTQDAADARYIELAHQGAPTGRRLTVAYSPDDAVRLGADQLLAQGFALREEDLNARLHGEGSEWVAQALWIGDHKKSWRRGILADLVEEIVPVDLIPGLRRAISPTLAVVAARPAENGGTELCIFPHMSKTGDPQSAFAAAPKIRAAIDGVIEASRSAAALISVDAASLGIADERCPASPKAVRRLLGWK